MEDVKRVKDVKAERPAGGLVCCLVGEATNPGALAGIARACSPRVESHGDRVVIFDASGLTRVIGPPRQIASEVAALAMEQGVMVRIALAPTLAAAWLMAHAQIGQTVVEPSRMSAMLGALPLRTLATLPGMGPAPDSASRERAPGTRGDRARHRANALDAFERWGLKTLGQVAKLPRHDVHARLGDEGVRLQMAACGQDASPLVPAGAAAEFLERLVLEWPIEGLEPLTFVLSRLCDALSISLERADRGAVTVTTRLKLVDRTSHARTLNLPAPMRDAKVLRTLIVLDLESHPPGAGIDEVAIEIGVVPGRIAQGSLLDRALPSPEELATLTARLIALAGESRVGAPTLLDTHDERTVGVLGFVGSRPSNPAYPTHPTHLTYPKTVLRRFRLPVPARVVVERGGPVRVVPSSSAIPAGTIVTRAGPWRTSGRWWTTDRTKWDRDEWDVELANGGCYRLARIRDTGQWEIEGEMD